MCMHGLNRKTGFRILGALFKRLFIGNALFQPIKAAHAVPHADRQNRFDRIIDRAEKAVVHPHGKAELLR